MKQQKAGDHIKAKLKKPRKGPTRQPTRARTSKKPPDPTETSAKEQNAPDGLVSPLPYTIIASSSKGNAVLIGDVMVDIGIPYKTIKPYLYKTKYILITHIHTDHIRKSTYNHIRKDFPAIDMVANWQVAQQYPMDHIIPGVGNVQIGPYSITPFEAVHDVLCHGFVWETRYSPPRTAQGDTQASDDANTSRIIYCTDTSDLDNAPPGPYDYLFLESNHDEKKIEAVRGQKSGGYDPYLSAMRHLSTKACKTFYYLNRRDKDSELIELHRSERFY